MKLRERVRRRVFLCTWAVLPRMLNVICPGTGLTGRDGRFSRDLEGDLSS